ncbi:MAG: hypothetical protein CMD20_06980 [Flavobacteriales bacterium]|nr:hypothetical protein [Flavobacteriales bacterium]|tara:strand:+ start:176 stop:736 length:561 start_codon:yes stop_codon:yes gene_type:complete
MNFKNIIKTTILLFLFSCSKENELENNDVSDTNPVIIDVPCESELNTNYLKVNGGSVSGYTEFYFSSIEDNTFMDFGLKANHSATTVKLNITLSNTFIGEGHHMYKLYPYETLSSTVSKKEARVQLEIGTFEGKIRYNSLNGSLYVDRFSEDSIKLSFCDIDVERDGSSINITGSIQGELPENYRH